MWPAQHLKGVWTNLPEILFALGFGYALFPIVGFYALIASVWSYIWMQSGTWIMLPWDKKGVRDPNRSATLRPLSEWITKKLGHDFDSVTHARVYAAIKGLLITLPVGGTGILLWPLAYEIGNRLKRHWISEVLSGAGAGLSIWAFKEALWIF